MIRTNKSTKFVGIIVLILFLSCFYDVAYSQNERSVFRFLNNMQSNRALALGGDHVSSITPQMTDYISNPALLNSSLNRSWALSYQSVLDAAKSSSLGAVYTLNEKYILAADLYYTGYGDFDRTDQQGAVNGSFSPYELAMRFTLSSNFGDGLHLGISPTLAYAKYDIYNSTAVSLNGGLHYANLEHRYSFGLSFRNLGAQLSNFNGQNEPLPFDISATLSRKLLYLPLELYISGTQLNDWSLQTVDEDEAPKGFEQFKRHIIFGGEFTFGKVVNMRFGYNPWVHQNYSRNDETKLVGFRWGTAIHFKRFDISLSRFNYNSFGSQWQLGLSSHF